MMTLAERYNLVRWSESVPTIVESFFIKLFIPEHRSAFWARYTLRKGFAGESNGCLWAIYTTANGDKYVGIEVFSPEDIMVGKDRFYLKIGQGELSMGRAIGKISSTTRLEWDLKFETGCPCFIHLPFDRMYDMPFPKNKIVSPHFSTRFYGMIKVGDVSIYVDKAKGLQGHNWGSQVSDNWAWSHVNTFEEEDAALEIISSQISMGPIVLPSLSVVGLIFRGNEYFINSPLDMVRTKVKVDGLKMEFIALQKDIRIQGVISASPAYTVGLDYISTDGGHIRCENSNLADATVTIEKLHQEPFVLKSHRSATLELGGSKASYSVPVLGMG